MLLRQGMFGIFCPDISIEFHLRTVWLQRKLQTSSKYDKPCLNIWEIKDVSDQLSSIGSPLVEKMKIFAALHGLGKDDEPIKTSIEGLMDSTPSHSFEEIAPRLTNFDNVIQGYETSLTILPHLAFNVSRSNNSYSNRGWGNSYGIFDRGRGSFSTRDSQTYIWQRKRQMNS